ncbi:MAG TPA: hypothetical protein VHH73_19995 [Verrucomicrobiae bacterium]|nr:hypothetical protein [Verrucomicrobiae bacterium]
MNDGFENLSMPPEGLDLAKLQAQMQRPAKNVNLDGSFELGWGTAMLCFSLVPYINAILPKSIWVSWWTVWIGYLPLICGGFAPYAIPRMVKEFITWPRTGYVANPNDMKLIQLVMLMGFGVALGYSLVAPLLLVSEIREAISRPAAHGAWQGIIWHGIRLFVCAALAVYLGRKTIKKHPLPPTHGAALLGQGLGQTVAGKQILRTVKFTLLLMLVGIPIMVIGVVFGLMYLSKLAMRRAEVDWPQWGMLGFLVATNAILYLMGNGGTIKQHRWKWLMLAVMLIGPIIIAPVIPHPAATTESLPFLEQFPPVMLSIGFMWFLSGAATLTLFIRRNPSAVTEAP